MNIEGYLTQSKLASVTLSVTDAHDWIGTELKIPNAISNRYRWDMGLILNGKQTYVEFGGSQHYCNANAIWRDHRKDKIVSDAGFEIIRIPYWVQLTTQTMNYYFGLDVEIQQDFPHGFIDKKAEVPASFCEMGIKRFISEFDALPDNIKFDVAVSLENKAKTMDMSYVAPSEIVNLTQKSM